MTYDPTLTFLTIVDDKILAWETEDNSFGGVHTITVTATGDLSGVTLDQTYTLTVEKSCLFQTISQPSVSDQIYIVYDPAASYEVSVFGNDEPDFCPLTYTIDIPAAEPWITEIAERTVAWQTNDNTFASETYTVSVTATGPEGVT